MPMFSNEEKGDSPHLPQPALRLSGVSKAYRLYHRPIDRLKEALHPHRKSYHRLFWAVRDVTLSVNRGETVGIVGRNGCGKSTLLKIISGVTRATEGHVGVHGRVSALLELGTGFNPELTGLENIYFNGLLMGLSRDQIKAKLDEILAFADIGPFIEQPVRSYSSGMFARLGFAVAAAVDPDILIVDEALAVGDEAFQRKCFVRLQSLKDSGATILFVSHAAATVVDLCNRAVLMDAGEAIMQGRPKDVVNQYHRLVFASPEQAAVIREEIRQGKLPAAASAPPAAGAAAAPEADDAGIYDPTIKSTNLVEWPERGARITDPHVETLAGRRVNILQRLREYQYVYRVRFSQSASRVGFGMMVKTVTGYELGGAATIHGEQCVDRVEAGTEAEVRIRFMALMAPGAYFLNAGVISTDEGKEVMLHRLVDAVMVRLQGSNMDGVTGQVSLLPRSSVRLLNGAA